MSTILLILICYVLGQAVYIYNSDAKVRAKCKDKGIGDVITILWDRIWTNHKFWYKDSDLEDAVQDVKRDGAKVVAQAKVKGAELIADAKEEAAEVVAKAKTVVAKAKAGATKAKAPVKKVTKAPAKVNKAAPKAKVAKKK